LKAPEVINAASNDELTSQPAHQNLSPTAIVQTLKGATAGNVSGVPTFR
jgi:hypothetical protein